MRKHHCPQYTAPPPYLPALSRSHHRRLTFKHRLALIIVIVHDAGGDESFKNHVTLDGADASMREL